MWFWWLIVCVIEAVETVIDRLRRRERIVVEFEIGAPHARS